VLLEWQTGYEINNVGFNIYLRRRVLEEVTRNLLRGRTDGRAGVLIKAGLAYSWWDKYPKEDDASVRYWLEDIDVSGRTAMRGPYGIEESVAGSSEAPTGKGEVSLLSALGRRRVKRILRRARPCRSRGWPA